MMILAADPGLHLTGWALIHLEARKGILGTTGFWRAPPRLTGDEAAASMIRAIHNFPPAYAAVSSLTVVESQQVYEGRARKGKPADLIRLATIAGAVSCSIPADQRWFPLPAAWKGQASKLATHLEAVGWLGYRESDFEVRSKGGEGYLVPLRNEHPWHGERPGDYHAIMDAVALAVWAAREVLSKEHKAAILAELDRTKGGPP